MSDLPAGTVTLLFSDIEGSTRLLQRAGDAYPELLAEHRRVLAAAFDRHGGHVVDSEGDAFFVAFASAAEAVAAAAEAQRALAGHDWPGDNEIRVRMGVHTGEPAAVEGRYVGLDVHHASRVMAAGHGGQVLLSESTRALLDDGFQLRDLGEHRLKDLSGPQRLFQLQIDGGPSEFPPLKTLDNRPTNLPVLANALVGRERELDETRELLARDEVRLLTLTGPGGTGKTRLALQAAAELVDSFANGVFFVSLAPVRDWELVVPTIARSLGLREQSGETLLETLTEYVRERQLLLLLDNFEQVVPAAPAIAGLLAAAPKLSLLVTSRTTLRLSAERTYAVPPLLEDEAVRLFVERAQAVSPEFVLDGDADTVGEICSRLDGLPLAIELVAPRVRVLPPPALLRRLDERLGLLTGGAQDLEERQRTLRATIDWSYGLLLDSERALFMRLGVFIGGCRLDAAEAVLDGEDELEDLLDGVGSLVEKSLLVRRIDPDGEPRFWMLETIREFALETLAASGALVEMRRRHAAHFLELAERIDLASRTGDQASLFAELELENANLRAAVDWARETEDAELFRRLATALWGFWATRGYVAEGRSSLEAAAAASDDPPPRILLGLATLRMLAGESEGLLDTAEAALSACEESGDEFGLAQAWNLVGRIEGSVLADLTRGEQAWRRALDYAERGKYAAERAESISWLMVSAVFGAMPANEGIELCKQVFDNAGDDAVIQAFARVERAALEAMSGRFDLARDLYADGKRAIDELGLKVYAAIVGQEAFYIEMLAGRPEAAAGELRASYDALEQMGERRELATIAGFLAHALYDQGEFDEAERYSRASERAAAPDDVHAQALWRTARAKILARRGEHSAAEAMARSAVDLTEPTDLLNAQAFALLDLAAVLAESGRTEDAGGFAREAAVRFERKGNLPGHERALATADELARPNAS